MNRLAKRLASSLSVYRDRRMLVIAGLGFSSGLPILLVYSTLTLWMTELDISLKTIGFASTVLFPYKLKFLWAPLIDRIKLGPFGLRKGWLFLTQLGLMVTITGVGFSDPGVDLAGCLWWAVALGIMSATHDIVVDGYRVEILEPEEQGAGAAVVQLGYRIAMIVAGAGAIYFAHFWDWHVAYFIMAGFVGVGMVATAFAQEPPGSEERVTRRGEESTGSFLLRTINEGAIEAFRDMLRRRGAFLFICFIMLFTLGDALLSSATNSFLIKMDFSKLEIANVVKSFGTVATIFGVFVGGTLVNRQGLVRALWIAGFAQMLSNLTFCIQALVGYDVWLLTFTIFVEKFSTGLAGAAFVGYLSALCSRNFGATHYAMLSAVSGVVKVAIGAFWGAAVAWLIAWSDTGGGRALLMDQFTPESMGWALYFFATTIIAAPGLVLLFFLNKWNMTGLTGRNESADSTKASKAERPWASVQGRSRDDQIKVIEHGIGTIHEGLPKMAPADDWDTVCDRIFPALRSTSIISATLSRLPPSMDLPHLLWRPSLPGMVVAVCLDLGDSVRYLVLSDLEAWGVDEAAVYEAAYQNSLAAVPALPPIEPGNVLVLNSDTIDAVSYLLAPGWFAGLTGPNGERPIAYAADRDTLTIFSGEPEVIAAMSKAALAEYLQAPRGVSPCLYTVNDKGDLVPLEVGHGHPATATINMANHRLFARQYELQADSLKAYLVERDQAGVFLATVMAVKDQDGKITTLCSWGEGLEYYLPDTDEIMFVSEDKLRVSFDVVWEVVPECLQLVPHLAPTRWETLDYPSPEQFEEMRRRSALD